MTPEGLNPEELSQFRELIMSLPPKESAELTREVIGMVCNKMNEHELLKFRWEVVSEFMTPNPPPIVQETIDIIDGAIALRQIARSEG